MRKAYWCVLVLICTAGGCFSLPPSWPANKPPPALTEQPRPAKPVPVTSDQVNEMNAREKADDLQREINLDANAEVSGLTPADAQAKRAAPDKDH